MSQLEDPQSLKNSQEIRELERVISCHRHLVDLFILIYHDCVETTLKINDYLKADPLVRKRKTCPVTDQRSQRKSLLSKLQADVFIHRTIC